VARGISAYKGVWHKAKESKPMPRTAIVPPDIDMPHAADSKETESSTLAQNAAPSIAPALLEHRYRLLVLVEHRHKLGRHLLEVGHRPPSQLAWAMLASFGHSFRPWAHARIFALGCYLGVDMAPELLRQLRHPWRIQRFRRTMFGLWRLLQILAHKKQKKPWPSWAFRLCLGLPPLAIWIYERQLQNLMAEAKGMADSKPASSWIRSM
jgi:hypothetical protein